MTALFASGFANCGLPFSVTDPGSGELVAPDSTPTFKMYRTGGSVVEVTGVAMTAVSIGVGRYVCSFTAPTYTGTDSDDPAWLFYVEATAVVQGVSYTRVIGTFQLSVANQKFQVVTNGGNTATTFKTDLASATNNAYKGALISWGRASAFYGQIREITAYDGTTKFVTLDAALTGTPSGGEIGELIVR